MKSCQGAERKKKERRKKERAARELTGPVASRRACPARPVGPDGGRKRAKCTAPGDDDDDVLMMNNE
jgi:hypothetical protein